MNFKMKNSIINASALHLMVALIVLCAFETRAQEIEVEYISISDGLASPTVNDVIQDSYGILWVATTNGVQKYDGYKFETFKNQSGNPASLQNNDVWGLMEDPNHDIWVSTAMGVSKYDRRKNEFINYAFAEQFGSSAGGLTFNTIMDSRGTIWATTISFDLVYYDRDADRWKYAEYEVSDQEQPVHNGVVLGFAEDSKGGLWFGSSIYGLMHRPNSDNAFRPISTDQFGEVNFISEEHRITAIHADTDDVIWITTRNGIFKYYPEKGSLTVIKKYDEAQLNVWNNWNRILADSQGNIWIANNYRGILKFESNSDRYEEISIAGRLKMRGLGWNITFTYFIIDRSGIFWFGSREQGLMKYDPVSKPFSFFEHDAGNPLSLSPNGVYGILASKLKPGVVYVGSRGGGLNIFDPAKGTFEKVTFKAEEDMFGGSVRSVAESADGTLWLGTWGDGLIQLDRNFQEVRRYKYMPESDATISDNRVRVIKEDQSGRFWVGTNDGLNVFDPKTGHFQRIASKMTRSYPKSILDEIEVLASSGGQIGIIEEMEDFQNQTFSIEVKTKGTYYVMSVGEGTIEGMVDYGWIENAAKDTLWRFGSFEESYYAGGASKNRISIGEVTLEPGTYNLRYISDDSHSYNKWNAPAPEQTTLYGIVLVKPKDARQIQSFHNALSEKQRAMMISGNNIADIEIGEKYVWVSANGNGLNRIDPANNEVKFYSHEPGNEQSLSNNAIFDIHEDKRGMIWLATEGGINKLDPVTEIFTRYSEADGLPTNLTEVILEGDNGEMWIATQNGISQMVTNEALGKVTFINYNSTDGLGGDAFLSQAATRAADGRFYFGGEHGLTTFSSIAANNVPPDLVFSNLLISNKSVFDMADESPLTTTLQDTEYIQLSFNQNNLSFEFAALHYANPAKNQYAHYLKGYDEDWVYDNRNFASYTNLDPGEYEFMIRASNAYGIWNEAGKSIKFTIMNPWWRTWWAYGAYAIILVLGVFTIDRLQRQRLIERERKHAQEKELKQAKEIEKAYENLKATQSQLIQAEKMASLGELTAGIAHEIQNPLNFVNNFAEVNQELLEEMQEEMEKQNFNEVKAIATIITENEKKIAYHGRRADSIVKGMLQHSRSSNGQKEPTDINALADEYLRLSYHGLRAKDKSFNASFETDLDSTLPKVNVVPQDIGRVLLNLINNAFYVVDKKARESLIGYKPEVIVTTKLSPAGGGKGLPAGQAGVEISVKDNGPGIPQDIRDKIFQPFFTTKPTGQGTGLGLSLSYDIVKAHGGELRVETREGEGSEFIILLVGE
jgi:signal transduction histidine kinase/ligand-binding sensor domain-containing protein